MAVMRTGMHAAVVHRPETADDRQMLRILRLCGIHAVNVKTYRSQWSGSSCLYLSNKAGQPLHFFYEIRGSSLPNSSLCLSFGIRSASHYVFGIDEITGEADIHSGTGQRFSYLRCSPEFSPSCFRVPVEIPSSLHHFAQCFFF